MEKIILVLWTLSPTGQLDRLEIEGFRTLETCRSAAVSLTEPAVADGWSPATVVRCLAVPK
jgi:hypothetical protein